MRVLIVALSLMLMAPTKPPVDVARSIVALQMPNEKGELHTFCSGVVAQTVPVAYIMTEAHCLDDEDLTTLRVEGKALVEVARSHELVLLRVQGWLASSVPARVAERDAPSGSRVVANGWAFGRFMAHTSGIVAGVLDDKVFFDMQSVRGMSGGPVTNEQNEVISLVRAFQTDAFPHECSPNGFSVGARTQHLRDLVVVARNAER